MTGAAPVDDYIAERVAAERRMLAIYSGADCDPDCPECGGSGLLRDAAPSYETHLRDTFTPCAFCAA